MAAKKRTTFLVRQRRIPLRKHMFKMTRYLTLLSDKLFGGFIHELNSGLGQLYELIKEVQTTVDLIEGEVENTSNGVDEIVDKLKHDQLRYDEKNAHK